MPSERFFNLSPEKRELLLQAAKQEFSRETFEKASINKIIQNANISRGSFYTYFVDKMDLLLYMLQDFKTKIEEIILRYAEAGELNIFKVFMGIFDMIVEYGKMEENSFLCKNIIAYIKTQDIDFCSQKSKWLQTEEIVKRYFEAMRQSGSNIETWDDFMDLVEMLTWMLRGAMLEMFLRDIPAQTVRKRMSNKLRLLEEGIIKKT